jgi:hypothetical protein
MTSLTFKAATLAIALRGYGKVVRPESACGAASAVAGIPAAAPAAVAPDTLKNTRRETVESMSPPVVDR